MVCQFHFNKLRWILCLSFVATSSFAAQFPDPGSQWKDPGFAKLIWVQSPNYGPRPEDWFVDTVVIHSTAGGTLGSVTKWFQTPESKVSAHFTIGKDGSIVQNVSTFDRAWHAGVSKDKLGRENVNNFSVGIELVNLNDGKDPYPPEQIQALKDVLQMLRRRFPEIKQFTSHEFIAQPRGRKSDPKNFPWDDLKDLGVELVYQLPPLPGK